jgi:hypothetical protein
MNEWAKTHKHELFVCIVSLAIVAVSYSRVSPLVPGHPNFDKPWDHHKYIYMAEQGPFDFHIAPFCWRVGVPLLARMLPFGTQSSFLIVTFLAVAATGVAVFALIRRAGFSSPYAWFGVLLFYSIGNNSRLMMEAFWVPDAFVILLLTCVLIAAIGRRPIVFMVLVAVGVAFKESILFAAPLYYTLNTGRLLDGRFLLRSLLLVIPAIGVLVFIRFMIPALNADPAYVELLPERLWQVYLGRADYDMWSIPREIMELRGGRVSFLYIVALYVRPFGALTCLLPVFALRRNLLWILRFSPFFLLLYAQLFFAVESTRLLVFGSPVMVMLAVEGLRSLNVLSKLNVYYLSLLPVSILIFGLIPADRHALPVDVQLLIIAAFAALSMLLRRSPLRFLSRQR